MRNLSLSILLFSVAVILSAASSPDNRSSKIGLTIEDRDKVDFIVYSSDEERNVGEKVNQVVLSRSGEGEDSYWLSNFYFKVNDTSSHALQIKLSADGPMKSVNGDTADEIDYSMSYGGSAYDEDTSASAVTADIPEGVVFGRTSSAADASYGDVNYYRKGSEDVLTSSDSTMGYFSVKVLPDDMTGKKNTSYQGNIYIEAVVVD